jgi:hypothetical protein
MTGGSASPARWIGVPGNMLRCNYELEVDTMAIGLRAKFGGGTQEQYDAVHRNMGVHENPPSGMIFHMAGPLAEGWGVIDVWESRDAFDQFFQNRLQPALQELGDRTFQAPPDIKEFPEHHFTKP